MCMQIKDLLGDFELCVENKGVSGAAKGRLAKKRFVGKPLAKDRLA